MKKALVYALSLIVSLTIMTSCGTNPQQQQPYQQEGYYQQHPNYQQQYHPQNSTTIIVAPPVQHTRYVTVPQPRPVNVTKVYVNTPSKPTRPQQQTRSVLLTPKYNPKPYVKYTPSKPSYTTSKSYTKSYTPSKSSNKSSSSYKPYRSYRR
jgi:hypothetical protein